MKRDLLGVLAGVMVSTAVCADMTYTFEPVADAFMRANAPAANYGGAGALSVSGSAAVNGGGVANGVFSSLMRFDLSGLAAAADILYGANQWYIDSASLSLTETAAPNNALFNRGVGQFSITWVEDDLWAEGTGSPATPTADGVAYEDLGGLLDPLADATLGVYTNAGLNTRVSYSLLLESSFIMDAMSGGSLSLYFAPEDNSIGYTFNSRSFGTAGSRPALAFTVVPEPSTASLLLVASGVLWLRRRIRG